MAPSRALHNMLSQRSALQGFKCLNCTLTESVLSRTIRNVQAHRGISAMSKAKQPFRSMMREMPSTRLGSSWRAFSSATATVSEPVEAPDYLNEKEKALFDLLKTELTPTSLEASICSSAV
jgi:hypothetical protein